MVEKITPISEFPQDNRIWRVDYKRADEQNAMVPSELTIEIVITRFKPEIETEYKKSNNKPKSRKFYSKKTTNNLTIITTYRSNNLDKYQDIQVVIY